jgi:hypothetical protein
LKNQQKINLFDQEGNENWNKAKADENKSDFPKTYYGKDFESLKVKGITPLLD